MTNKEYYLSLNDKGKQDFENTCKEHPLNEYIDWEAFFDSEDGNEMHFVAAEKEYDEELGDIIILKELTENNEDYLLVFIVNDTLFAKIADTSCLLNREVVL